MSVTSAEFWNLLVDSRLLPAAEVRQWQAAAQPLERTSGSDTAAAVARWLIRQQVLTQYQAELLLNGRAGPFRYGDYEVLDRIRRGRLRGMFRARHVPTRYRVLLRFAAARVAQDPRQWALARQYHRLTVVQVHPQLQRIFALEDSSGYRFLVCENLEGESLAQRLPTGVGLPLGAACRIAQDVAQGVAALHEARQIHGDIRPANVWQEVNGQVKLLRDWLLPPVVPDLGSAVGSAAANEQAPYAAPELAHPGTPLSKLTDIYALGCTLHELLVGQTPFAGSTPAETLARRAQDALPSLEPRGVPAALTRLLGAMLAPDPRDRIASASEVAQLLTPWADSPGGATASPPGPDLAAYESALANPRTAPPAPPPIVSHIPDRAGAATVVMSPERAPLPPLPPPVREAVDQRPVEPPSALAVAVPEVTRGDQTPVARLRRQQRAQRRRALNLVLWAIPLVALVAVVGRRQSDWRVIVGPTGLTAPATGPVEPTPSRESPRPPGKTPPPSADTAERYEVVEDDGATLWLPPTQAEPLPLKYVPPGTQLLLTLRMADLLATEAGRQLFDVWGPDAAALRRQWETAAGYTWRDVEQLVVGWRVSDARLKRPVCIVWLREPRTVDELRATWGDPDPVSHQGATYFTVPAHGWSFFVPHSSPGVFVMGDEADVRDVIEQGDAPPLLRRDLAQLWQASDQLRHASLLVAADILLAQERTVASPGASGDWASGRRSLEWFLGHPVRACLASLHVGDYAYFELRGLGQTSAESPLIAEGWRARLREMPDRVEAHFADVYPSAYWRRVALRVPEMMRVTAALARVGVEQDQAICNVALPPHAAHNLVFAASMAWAAAGDDRGVAAKPPTTIQHVPASLEELLATRWTVTFALQSLEAALQSLVDDVRARHPALPFPFAIEFAGQDLQLEGITRNQQIANFEAVDRPLADILTSLVMRANPVTTVTAPSEPAQTLVWTPAPDPQDPTKQILLITTRAAAARKGYNLPGVFRQP